MSWNVYHSEAERLSSEAEVLAKRGATDFARRLYIEAAALEAAAFECLKPVVHLTRGITAVSAVACLYKAGDWKRMEKLANKYLKAKLPKFAVAQIKEMLEGSAK